MCETCAVRLTLVVRRCCYYCAVAVCLIIMSNTTCTIDEKKSDTKANDQRLPTIRIQAELFEPTKNRYPVFNYQRLLSDEVSVNRIAPCYKEVHRRSRVLCAAKRISAYCTECTLSWPPPPRRWRFSVFTYEYVRVHCT